MPTMMKIKSVAMLLAGLYVAFLAFLAFVAFSLTLKSICVALNVSFYVLLIRHTRHTRHMVTEQHSCMWTYVPFCTLG